MDYTFADAGFQKVQLSTLVAFPHSPIPHTPRTHEYPERRKPLIKLVVHVHAGRAAAIQSSAARSERAAVLPSQPRAKPDSNTPKIAAIV
jgi:hypothetical protein